MHLILSAWLAPLHCLISWASFCSLGLGVRVTKEALISQQLLWTWKEQLFCSQLLRHRVISKIPSISFLYKYFYSPNTWNQKTAESQVAMWSNSKEGLENSCVFFFIESKANEHKSSLATQARRETIEITRSSLPNETPLPFLTATLPWSLCYWLCVVLLVWS